MARHKIVESRIRTLTKPGIYSDGDGLFLRVRQHRPKNGGDPTVTRQWLFVFKRGGKRTEIALGGHGQGTAPVSLALAREKAEGLRQRLAHGEDLQSRKTFLDVMKDTIAVRTATSKNAKHRDQWSMTLNEYAKPLHNKLIGEITRDDVVETLKPIWTEKPETADRTRMRIAAVIDQAKARGLFVGDNPADWRGGLKELLPARQKLSRGHHAAAAYKDIPAIMTKLGGSQAVSARAAEFACLTAGRSGEVRGAVWPEIDFAEKLWVVPAERMKASREHRVPLSDRAIEILNAQKEIATNELIFGGGKEGVAISDTAIVKSLRAASEDKTITLHGLRSSFRDWAGDETHHPREVIEQALAHTIKDKAEAAYRRKDAIEKRRLLMADWAKYCNSADAENNA